LLLFLLGAVVVVVVVCVGTEMYAPVDFLSSFLFTGHILHAYLASPSDGLIMGQQPQSSTAGHTFFSLAEDDLLGQVAAGSLSAASFVFFSFFSFR
jgi:hypothetical protein